MSKPITPFFHKSIVAAAALALTAGAFCTYVVRADDTKMSDDKKLSTEESTMVTDKVDKMKKEASEPSQAEIMKTTMAKEMVMDQMSMTLSKDPTFKQESMDLMDDANFKKVHDDAKTMAEDPAQMKKMKDEIMGDPKEMKEVMHHAMMMDMMQAKMAEKTGSSGETMEQKMMDKMKDSK